MKRLLFSLVLSGCYLVVFAQYDYFSSDGNLFNQNVIETSDGGFLLASYEDCYTPGSITIEGCVYGIHLVKTSGVGDTLWTNRVDFYTQFTSGLHLFEHDDNNYTIITTTNQSYLCNGIGIGLFGLRQINVIRIDSMGALISEVKIPNNCQLTLRDIERLGSNQFLLASYFDGPGTSGPEREGRLSIIDNQGTILNQVAFPEVELRGGTLSRLMNGNILLSYVDPDATLHFLEFNNDLELVNESTNDELDYSCLGPPFNDVYSLSLQDGNLLLVCFGPLLDGPNTQFFLFDTGFNLVTNPTYTLEDPTHFLEIPGGLILNTSLNETLDTLSNTQINYFNTAGDSLYAEILVGSENERPRAILLNSNEELVVVGSANCCNESTAVGPGQAFITTEEIITSNNFPVAISEGVAIHPNPARSSIWVDLEGEYQEFSQCFLQLYSITGRLVLDERIEGRDFEVNMEHLPVGTYLFAIWLEGQVIGRGKLIKLR